MKDHEFYPTPLKLAELLVERLLWQIQLPPGSTPQILEPSAGSGSFVFPLAKIPGATVTAIEPFIVAPDNLPENVEWGEYSVEQLHEALEGDRPFDLVCGNPPYTKAEEHLRLLMTMGRKGGGVGFLLRLGFLASRGRVPFFSAYPPKHVYVLPTRPSFVWTYTCKECKKKMYVEPGTELDQCQFCGHLTLMRSTSDAHDYCFPVWEFGLSPNHQTTVSWLNSYEGEGER